MFLEHLRDLSSNKGSTSVKFPILKPNGFVHILNMILFIQWKLKANTMLNGRGMKKNRTIFITVWNLAIISLLIVSLYVGAIKLSKKNQVTITRKEETEQISYT